MEYIIDFYVLYVGSRHYSHDLQPTLTTWSTSEEKLMNLGNKWLQKAESHIAAKRFTIRELNSNGTSRLVYTGDTII